MRLRISFLACCFCVFTSIGYSQGTDSAMTASSKTDSVKQSLSKSNITFLSCFQLLKGNFLQQAFVPFQISRRDLVKFAGFSVVTIGVMRFDKPVNRLALKLHENSSTLRVISPQVTKFGGRYALFTMIGIGSWSYIFRNQKLINTTLLATQSYVTSGFWVSSIKFITGRERPSYYNPQTNEKRGVWHGMFFQFRKTSTGDKPDGAQFSSFPSGHAASAFSIATVYAEMYKDKSWVPWLAYTSASLIALSRVTENRHWASDILVGSALGYVCGKQVVRNFYRLERLNSLTRKKKNLLGYNINFINGKVMPELIYTFR